MSNVEEHPAEVQCEAGGATEPVQVLVPREVPLGGLRAMSVRRTLPSRDRSLIGAWCFADHYGPDEVSVTGGMSVAPHPHTGLATVSWLFTGTVEHRDSAGNHAMVRPGELNLMTAGAGISHSEVSTADTTVLHGVQLWVVSPEHTRHGERRFDHHVPEPVTGDGWTARVFLGSLLGSTSPVATDTPLLGAEITLDPDTELVADVPADFELGFLVDHGTVTAAGQRLVAGELGYLAPGNERISLHSGDSGQDGNAGARLIMLGGPPFGESIVMWWNFIGRDHDEIVRYREEWQAQLRDADGVVADSQLMAPGPYGIPVGDHLPPIPAPPMPGGRLKHRG
ncbi:pirin family protein [Propionibacteriaceae bacterium Y2011]